MVKQAIFSIKSEQKRTDDTRAPCIAKSANNAISCADLLDLDDCAAFAGSVRRVKTFRDDAIKIATGFLKPFAGSPVICRCRRQA